MRLPEQLSLISLDSNWVHRTPYPPLGFIPFSDYALGNGDTFGLYWPIGRESLEPIVVESWHDSWTIQPVGSSLAAFLRVVQSATEEHPEPPTVLEDPDSPFACFVAAKEAQQVEGAIVLLERATTILPEYTDALSLLWAQYVRAGRIEDAIVTALRAIISPPCFGARPLKALRWLCGRESIPSLLSEDPIWLARKELTLSFGGKKENADFPVLLNAIHRYLDQSEFVRASTLMQTYAELMWRETVSFRERYGFIAAEFIAWQIEVGEKYAMGSRSVQMPES
ncbi:SMI1/KNR4 family protein [Herbaspirillum huttiense]|uniref:SMI1/KNR4 family protein n=1 Tax=Herbaspirillum huttiense TaxID=863372 RepID=UPI002176BC24|nr:SMI1/KNR4 family protein [Herbaspirillum huttiense]UWE14942.1 SMI1/KNR4 family protein [Herbaspirillum huttiense]